MDDVALNSLVAQGIKSGKLLKASIFSMTGDAVSQKIKDEGIDSIYQVQPYSKDESRLTVPGSKTITLPEDLAKRAEIIRLNGEANMSDRLIIPMQPVGEGPARGVILAGLVALISKLAIGTVKLLTVSKFSGLACLALFLTDWGQSLLNWLMKPVNAVMNLVGAVVNRIFYSYNIRSLDKDMPTYFKPVLSGKYITVTKDFTPSAWASVWSTDWQREANLEGDGILAWKRDIIVTCDIANLWIRYTNDTNSLLDEMLTRISSTGVNHYVLENQNILEVVNADPSKPIDVRVMMHVSSVVRKGTQVLPDDHYQELAQFTMAPITRVDMGLVVHTVNNAKQVSNRLVVYDTLLAKATDYKPFISEPIARF